MKRQRLLGVYETGLLAILFLIVMHAPLNVGFSQVWPEFADPIKAWKEVGLTLLAILATVLITKRGLWGELFQSRIIKLSLAFILLHFALVIIFMGDPEAIIAGLLIDLRFIVIFGLMYVLLLLRPAALAKVMRVAAAGAAIVLGFGLLQITVLPDNVLSRLGYSEETITPFTTIDRNPDFVRINSTLRGPNPLGALAVVYTALAVAYLIRRGTTASTARKWGATASAIVGVVVLYASYSRSAYLGLVAAGVALLLALKRVTNRMVIGIAAGAILIGGILAVVSSSDWFSNVVLHEDPESTVVKKSNDEHVASLGAGLGRVIRQPLGAGIGTTGSASLYDDESSNDFIIENNYFFVAHESGWLGLVLFLLIYVGVLVELWRRRTGWPALGLFASGVGLGLIGILLPVWVDETVALTWWGLAGAVLGTSGIIRKNHATRSRQQETTRAT